MNRRKSIMKTSSASIIGFTFALLLHVLLFLYMAAPVHPYLSAHEENSLKKNRDAMIARLISRELKDKPEEATLNIERSGTSKKPPRLQEQIKHSPAAKTAGHATPIRPEGNETPTLFAKNGNLILPAPKPISFRSNDVVQMERRSPIPCHRTSFSHEWARGQDEDLGAEVARKYLRWVGLYNPAVEQQYQRRAAEHLENC